MLNRAADEFLNSNNGMLHCRGGGDRHRVCYKSKSVEGPKAKYSMEGLLTSFRSKQGGDALVKEPTRREADACLGFKGNGTYDVYDSLGVKGNGSHEA